MKNDVFERAVMAVMRENMQEFRAIMLEALAGGTTKAKSTGRAKRKISAATRAKMKAAQKARWAKKKTAKK